MRSSINRFCVAGILAFNIDISRELEVARFSDIRFPFAIVDSFRLFSIIFDYFRLFSIFRIVSIILQLLRYVSLLKVFLTIFAGVN